jgi:hypothetical protein
MASFFSWIGRALAFVATGLARDPFLAAWSGMWAYRYHGRGPR